jgi:hypothetical protein
MELKQGYSKHLHELFLARFKGKIARIDKHGQVGTASMAGRPIEKARSSYCHIYPTQQTPSPKKRPLEGATRIKAPLTV